MWREQPRRHKDFRREQAPALRYVSFSLPNGKFRFFIKNKPSFGLCENSGSSQEGTKVFGRSKVSLRLGHLRDLAVHRTVIQYPKAASLPALQYGTTRIVCFGCKLSQNMHRQSYHQIDLNEGAFAGMFYILKQVNKIQQIQNTSLMAI